ncbi:MAG: carbohydrate ABC transporter permease [Salinibacter sp.]
MDLRTRRLLKRTGMLVLLLIWTVFVIFPIYWVATTSLKTSGSVYQGPKWIPFVDYQPSLETWQRFLGSEFWETLADPLLNSLVVSSVSTVFAVLFGTMAAYALTRYRFRVGFLQNRDILIFILSQRMMPPIVVGLAFYIMYRITGLLDTHLGLILVYIAFNLPLATWIMRNFLSQMPENVEEAAQIDGATPWQVFRYVVIPMSLPSLASTFLICFVFAWNEFLFALILTFQKARTIPILISAQHFQRGPQWWAISVLVIIAVVPAVIIAISMQRYLIQGLVPGGK